ncbi:molybdate ABC transporter substrate-binding protein [Acaryochloris thomasi]|nr:molybdate ABC transporter substrate-binding protein [Acaryochloris thomasi]
MQRCQFSAWFMAGLLACLLVSCSSSSLTSTEQTTSVTITVSAAASLQEALDGIATQFNTAHPTIAIDYNFGASGALQRQIEQGAPADVFCSAATKQMNALSEKGIVQPDSQRNLVTNSLVLIAPTNSNYEITDLTQLRDIDISRFAVGEFRSVPAGQYAQQVFTKLDLLDPLRTKFVFGNTVRNVLAAVENGNAELGMVYATDAALSQQVKVLTTVPEDSHLPIVYPVAMIQSTAHSEAAQAFINFLITDAAQQTFEEFGFGRA